MPTQTEIQKQITARIIEGLKNGVVPWKKPWRADPNSGSPANAISNRPYSGINPLLLDLVAMERGFTSRFWATYRQWESVGAQVKKRPTDIEQGQWATRIVYFKQVKKTRIEDGEEKTDSYPLMRFFSVFNVDQVEGEAVDHLRVSTLASKSEFDADFGPATAAIEATKAEIRYGGSRAFYCPPEDYIQLPRVQQFDYFHDYFCTAFHELAHWSEPRLGWKGSYAMGELIAEISSCYTAAQLGIPGGQDLRNHCSYIDGWLQAMQEDPKAIFKAASQAAKATAFILSFSRQEQPQSEELQVV